MSETGCAGAERRHATVHFKWHAASIEIQTGKRLPLATKKAAEPLSATVSAKLIFQSAMRLSVISITATAQSEAAATSKSFGGFFGGVIQAFLGWRRLGMRKRS
jgi:hypothetical protein